MTGNRRQHTLVASLWLRRSFWVYGTGALCAQQVVTKETTETGSLSIGIFLETWPKHCDIVISAPFTAVSMAAEAAKNTNIFICGQNVSWGKEGALTGEVSATMLAEAGCCYVIIGHSERRRLFHESDHDVAKKTLIALEAGLVPIVCLEETGEERDSGLSEEALRRQFSGGPGALTPEQFSRILIHPRLRQSRETVSPWNLIAHGFGLGTSGYPGFRFLHRLLDNAASFSPISPAVTYRLEITSKVIEAERRCGMRFSRLLKVLSLFLALGLVPTWAEADNPSANSRSARPGTVNYVEGQVSLGNQTLDEKSVGSTEVDAGQSLTTENGKAEVLLTPGVFLRLGNESSVRMISSSLIDTQVELSHGKSYGRSRSNLSPERHSRAGKRFDRPAAESRPIRL